MVALVWRRARGRTAIGIARRLRDAEAEYVVRLGSYRQTWNPARALGATNGLFGPGVARYRLDADGLVSLDWRPRAGAVQHLVGPLPPVAIPGTAAYRARQEILRPIKVVLGGYCAMLAVGCVLGYVLAGGSTNSRLKAGVWGGVAAFVAAWVGLHVWTIVYGIRRREAARRSAHDQKR